MKFLLLLTAFVFAVCNSSKATVYTTPGTASTYTLNDLVANSSGSVVFNAGVYTVNDTIRIALTDTLSITSDATVKFLFNTYIHVLGTIKINPPTGVIFTADNITNGFLGVHLDNSVASSIKKFTLEYAVSFKLTDSSPLIDSCTFQFNNNNASTTFGNGAISLFRSSPVITNSFFLNNRRAAIQGGANISNAPKIINCLFMGNNTSNVNVPQINLGSTSTAGEDTVKIINNQILRASTNSGGIGFLPTGNVYAVISGNIIKNNRYGLTFNGGANINALIIGNTIDSNNTQNNPALGGSGIAFSGGSSSSHQNSIVSNNTIRWNLWGITIQNGSKPNLGDLTNMDTRDDGGNIFLGNTNTTDPNIDLYNNSPYNIMAQNNYWSTADPLEIEARIFHQPDNAALGLVDYSAFQVVPVTLVNFTGLYQGGFVNLSWKTSVEINTDYFGLEKSTDGRAFQPLALLPSRGLVGETLYSYSDGNVHNADVFFYRLKIVDKNGSFVYSPVVRISLQKQQNNISVYPNVLHGYKQITLNISSATKHQATLSLVNASGQQIFTTRVLVNSGTNAIPVSLPGNLPAGMLYLQYRSIYLVQVIPLVNML